MKSKTKILICCLLLGLTFSNFAAAAIVNCGQASRLPANPTPEQIQANECTFGSLITTIMGIINLLLSWAWLVAIIYIVWSAWQMINAGGNDEAISTAKTTFTNAIIGFFLVMSAFVLLNFVVSLLTGNGMPRAGSFIDAFNLLHL